VLRTAGRYPTFFFIVLEHSEQLVEAETEEKLRPHASEQRSTPAILVMHKSAVRDILLDVILRMVAIFTIQQPKTTPIYSKIVLYSSGNSGTKPAKIEARKIEAGRAAHYQLHTMPTALAWIHANQHYKETTCNGFPVR